MAASRYAPLQILTRHFAAMALAMLDSVGAQGALKHDPDVVPEDGIEAIVEEMQGAIRVRARLHVDDGQVFSGYLEQHSSICSSSGGSLAPAHSRGRRATGGIRASAVGSPFHEYDDGQLDGDGQGTKDTGLGGIFMTS